MKKASYLSASVAALVIGVMLPAGAASANELGGWSEDSGTYTTTDGAASSAASRAAAPKHTGKSETKTISGTTNKRAHGWTTWVGVYHYTTAQMEESGGGKVYTTSGRQWGTSGTEAISPWRAFHPDRDLGSARTYYGK